MVIIIFIDTSSLIMYGGIVAVVDGVSIIIEGHFRLRVTNKDLHLMIWCKFLGPQHCQYLARQLIAKVD